MTRIRMNGKNIRRFIGNKVFSNQFSAPETHASTVLTGRKRRSFAIGD
jgi:hypothetical protein